MSLNTYGGPGSDEERTPNPMVFGTPMEPKAIDDGGGAVDPVLGASAGGVNSPSAIPSMAEGGAIPDDDYQEPALDSNAGVADDETAKLDGALQIVQQALMYGRQKHGLPGGGGSSDDSTPQQGEGGIPADDGEESYGEGGSIEDDIYASNNATDDGPQYGRPEVVDDPDAIRPPISGDNLDMSGHVGNESAGLRTNNDVAGNESAGLNTGSAPPQPQQADNSGAVPVAEQPADNSGAAPVVPPQQSRASGGIPDEYAPHNMLRNGVQSVLAYLQGKDAMPNDQALAIERSVAPAAKNDPAAVPVLAVAAAGSPDQQFAYLQRNRQIYDVAMAHGRAALNGVEGRPPSLDVAVQDATKAFSNVPDGENVHFVKHGDGVVAQVSGASGREQRGYPLTIEQFGQLLDTGKAGMFDRMMEPGGVRKVLGSFAPQEPQADGASTNPYLQQRVAQGADSQQAGGGGGGYGQYGRDPVTGKQFTEGNRPSTPSEAGDMAMMRRNAAVGDAIKSGDNTDKIAKKFGPDPRPMAGAGGVVSFPGYKAYQNKYDGGRNTDGGPDTTTAPNSARPVRVVGGSEDKLYQNGEDVTPDRQQEKALERIRAKNEGRGTIDEKMQLETLKGKNRIDAVDARGKYYTQHEDRLDARSAANRESREKIHAANVDAKLKQIASSSQNQHERTMAADIRAIRLGNPSAKLTPQQDQFLARVDQQLRQQPQQPAPQQQQQPSADQQALLWANANPNDPRAARIKQLHGVQ